MTRLLTMLRVCGGITILSVVGLWAAAASSGQNYGRLHFAFSEPARLKTSVNGNAAVLNFTHPVTQSAASIKASLPDYVRAVQLSPDKKRVTLTLSHPYRLRQFVSGNHVGIDLVPADEKPLILTDNATTRAEIKTEKKLSVPEDLSGDAGNTMPPTKPTKKPAAPEKKLPEKTKTAKAKPSQTAAKAKPVATIATTKPEKAAPVAEVSAPILTTKPAEDAPQEPTKIEKAEDPILSTKAESPEANHATSDPMLTTKDAAPAPLAPQAQAVDDAPTTEVATAPAASTTVPTTPEPTGAFIVTARTSGGETVINFPWKTRTGAAVFRRAQDIWIVFSHRKDVKSAMLRTVLPQQVINITQYAHGGNTVLRLVTDGTIHARADQAGGGYGWNVTLGKSPTPPAIDTPITADSLEGTMRMLLAIFDVAPTVRFFDPTAGDELLIIPAFENGRGVGTERNFVDMDVLSSPQGVAIVNRNPALTTHQTRSGFILGAADGLAISESLPRVTGTKPVLGASATSGVMMPYEQWYVPPEHLLETMESRLHAIGAATAATRADAMMELTKIYLAEGYGAEASGLLLLIKEQFPDYYTEHKLTLLAAAAHVMQHRTGDAAQDMLAPELNGLEEAALWHEVVALYAAPPPTAQALQQDGTDSAANTPLATPPAAASPPLPPAPAATPVVQEKPVFHFLKYNKSFIRFYPPRVRQRLANLAADAYLEDGQEEKALATYDTLMKDNVLEPVATDAEFVLGRVAQKKGEVDQAIEIFSRLSKQSVDRRVATRARHALAMLLYSKGKITNEEAAEMLERARITWRGDAVERAILHSLIDLHTEEKRYDELLRTQKALIEGFPSAPETLLLSGEMGELFLRIFNDGLADEMPPLKALSLFYEFRDLTPLGERGDVMIQRLADRLAAIDLIDRATQLLEHQVKFRVTAEHRSQIGARLALLYLINNKPQEALNVLEVTNYGTNSADSTQRKQLTAQALTKLGKHEEALGVLFNDTTQAGARLRLDVLWAMQDWPNVINHAEEILSTRTNLTDPLSNEDTEVLLKLSLGYCFEGDYVQLRYLRDYYSGLIPDNAYKQIFDFITNDTTPLDPEDFAMLAKQINRTEGFLSTFKEKIAAGKLSEALK